MKTVNLHVRPIHHRLESRVRAHIFLCMLADYVQWHMLEAWRELLFCDQDQQAKNSRPLGTLQALCEGATQGAQPHARRRQRGP